MPSQIQVDVASIGSLLIGGEWERVSAVVVAFAEFTVSDAAGVRTTHARGAHLAATIVGGPRNGQRIVLPIARIDAIAIA